MGRLIDDCETRSDEELAEDRVEEARDKDVAKVLADIKKKYTTLYGDNTDEKFSLAEVQEMIRVKMPRPYKLVKLVKVVEE